MSTLYLGSDPRSLAARMADALDAEAAHDFFAPATVAVPNRYVRKWLRLWLARRDGVAINLRFRYLEDALWELLRALDPRPHPSPPEPIDDNIYRLLILSVLLEEQDGDLVDWQRYLQLSTQSPSRLTCRRAWHLADRLTRCLSDYEFHRQRQLIDRWFAGGLGLDPANDFQRRMERSQRALFRHVTRQPDGRRALLNRLGAAAYRTFPQYANEVMNLAKWADVPRRAVHLFGFTEVTDLHARVLAWLGRHFDVHFYHLNVAASRLRDTPDGPGLRAVADNLRGTLYPNDAENDRGRELLRYWGRAGAEALGLLAGLLDAGSFTAELLEPTRPARKRSGGTVLSRLQDQLLRRPSASGRRLPQDPSLQIVGCPGTAREVETVYHSILHNLRTDPKLRQTDVAVLVTDMALYRPYLQAVFERPPQRLQYNLVDFSAAGLSTLGQALLGMLDLALESFTRSRVFEVLLNPCFLARLRVDRAQALTWLQWAETLGIYQGWDADEKQQQGYPRSPLYAWRLGLQRLRLGRYMEVVGDENDGPAPRFGHVIPFADLACSDREHLDAFCRAVEGLLPVLARLRTWQAGGQRWAVALQRLVQDFLDVPFDRPEEAQVRDELLAAFNRLALWDHLRPPDAPAAGLPLALVREYVQGQLEVLEGNRGEYLTGGVTLSALESMRPLPFAVLYVLGLGEDLFPGSNALSSFDLRGVRREPGDVRPAEQRQYQLLENVLAAGQKLYLLYNNHDWQKDQPLQPSVPLQQLQRYLGHHVVRGDFAAVEMPLHGDDERFYNPDKQPTYQDVLVHYDDAERCLALTAAERERRLVLDLHQQAELAEKRQQLQVTFDVTGDPAPPTGAPVTVALGELKRFLQFPAHESLRRHLRVDDDEELTVEDQEPLVTPDGSARQLIRQALHQLVLRAGQGDVEAALQDWDERFCKGYEDARLRSRVPEEAFGAIDLAQLCRDLRERIHGSGGLEAFLRDHASMTFCGPALLGESLTPLGARLRFPALRLRPGHELPAEEPREVRLVGSTRLAWASPATFEVLVITTSGRLDARDLNPKMFEPLLFYFALLANAEPNHTGTSSQQWLAKKHFRLHVAHAAGVQVWEYPAGCVTPAEALNYLTQLTRDLLDPGQFDLLPFEIFSKQVELRRAYYEAAGSRLGPADYRQLLQEQLAEEHENPFSQVPRPLVVELIRAEVPGDALEKVRRRFALLDRGPARCRRER